MPAFTREFFDPDRLDLFWQMIVERQRIYWRRLEGMPPPWTHDKIMRNEFITNVYRELDPGTVHLVANILTPEEDVLDKILNVFIYRVMGSRIDMQEFIGFQRREGFSAEVLDTKLHEMLEATGKSPFGEAYRTAAYTDQGSKDKITNVCRLFQTMAETLPVIYSELKNAQTVESAFRILVRIRGLGEFLAYQVMVDLLYPAPFEGILPFGQEEWAMAGPGARRGIWAMLQPGMKAASHIEVMRWLRDNQEAEFDRLGLDFPALIDESGEDPVPIPITLCNIQSCLCEYYKYVRIWSGEQKVVRKYEYQEPLVNELDEASCITVAPRSDSEGVGAVLGGAVGPDLADGGQDLGLGGVAVAGDVLLGLSGGASLDQHASSPQAPAAGAHYVIDGQVYELAAPGTGLHHHEQGVVPFDESENPVRDLIHAILQDAIVGGLDMEVALQLAVRYGNQAAVAQRQVESNNGRHERIIRVWTGEPVRVVHIEY